MALDIAGGLKNTKISKNPYVVIEELLSNAIDSYLIRANSEEKIGPFHAILQVIFYKYTLLNDYTFDLSLMDNGAGFGNEQVKAFITKDTSYKDRLGIEGIGKCKGCGRIQFFHYFDKVKIDSIFRESGSLCRRMLTYTGQPEIDENSFSRTQASAAADVVTTIELKALKSSVRESLLDNINLLDKFSANSLRRYVLVSLLHRLVSLKDILGDFQIEFESRLGADAQQVVLVQSDLPALSSRQEIEVPYVNSQGDSLPRTEKFTIFHYRLEKDKYKLKSNIVAFCAKSSIVKRISHRYLKGKSIETNPIGDYYHIVLIEGGYLDEHVSVQRDTFDIIKALPNEPEPSSPWMTYQGIYAKLDPIIDDLLKPPKWNRTTIVQKVEAKYGISKDIIADAEVRVHSGDTEETIAKRVLKTLGNRFLKDTSDIFDIKREIEKTDPRTPEFRQRINELAWRFTSSMKTLDMANLSQLVVRRAAIVEVLHLATQKSLLVQQAASATDAGNSGRKDAEIDRSEEGGKKKRDQNESIIHNIFFPQRKDSSKNRDHDIWLLNEEYQYFDYIASDVPLCSYSPDLFHADTDDAMNSKLREIFKENYEENRTKRPDIAIFNKEGVAIIIEFKAPGVDLDLHVGDIQEYAQLLAAKSNNRLTRFYGYLIGTQANKNRIQDYERFPNNGGWYKIFPLRDPELDYKIGTLNVEILFYHDIVNRARQRLEIYKKRLKIDLK